MHATPAPIPDDGADHGPDSLQAPHSDAEGEFNTPPAPSPGSPQSWSPHPDLDTSAMTPKAIRTFEIRSCALMIIGGREDRSVRQCARDLGCDPAALSHAVAHISAAIGIRGLRVTDTHSENLKRAKARARESKGQ